MFSDLTCKPIETSGAHGPDYRSLGRPSKPTKRKRARGKKFRCPLRRDTLTTASGTCATRRIRNRVYSCDSWANVLKSVIARARSPAREDACAPRTHLGSVLGNGREAWPNT